MEDRAQFIRRWAVLSKTAGQPQAARLGSEGYVFVDGYPMLARDFHLLSMKAIFGATTRFKVDDWNKLHDKAREMCEGLSLPLEPEREAYGVVKALKGFYGISEDSFKDDSILDKVKLMEGIMRQFKDVEGAA